MSDHFFNIDKDTIKIIGIISIPAVLVIGYLAGKLIESLLQRHRDNLQEFKAAYSKFARSFTEYTQQLEIGKSSLNMLILSEFRGHDLAMRDFVRYLGRFRKRKFIKTWNQYAAIYHEINNLGVYGIAAAIAPTVEALNSAQPGDARIWEMQRRKKVLAIIQKLLHIAQKQGWF